MITMRTVLEIGQQFPISSDPDFQQEAHLIRLMTMTEKGVRKAWKEACRRYGYDDEEVTPIDSGLKAFNRRSFFKPSTYRRKAFWSQLQEILLPAEQQTLWRWAQQNTEMTPDVQEVIDTVVAMTVPAIQ